MSKEFSEAFLYAESARSLWNELEERFGGIDGPRLYQINRDQFTFTRKQLYNDVLHLAQEAWDELDLLRKMLVCRCGANENSVCSLSKRSRELIEEDKLIQFLMGLNEVYDVVKIQMLLMDHFPTINKAYTMIQRVEKQREVHFDQTIEVAN